MSIYRILWAALMIATGSLWVLVFKKQWGTKREKIYYFIMWATFLLGMLFLILAEVK